MSLVNSSDVCPYTEIKARYVMIAVTHTVLHVIMTRYHCKYSRRKMTVNRRFFKEEKETKPASASRRETIDVDFGVVVTSCNAHKMLPVVARVSKHDVECDN